MANAAKGTGIVSRLALTPPAVGLAVYAGLAFVEATRLPHVGARVLFATAAVLAVTAVALLAARSLWSWIFAFLFLTATSVAYGASAAYLGWAALTDSSGGEWAGVRGLVVVVVGVGSGILCVVSGALAVALLPAVRFVGGARSALAWGLSGLMALVAIGLVAWLVGHEYWHKRLREQNACFSGVAIRCYALVSRPGPFTSDERRAFARAGCATGDASVCRQLVELLGAVGLSSGPEAESVEARCDAGDTDLCRRLGTERLKQGDRDGGRRALEKACAFDARECGRAARAAAEGGEPELSRLLLSNGCEREDAGSCRALLQLRPPALSADELAALETKTCLIGDINDCRPLMRRDLPSACRLICEGTTESRQHSCVYCARDAVAVGEPALAEEWLSLTCGRGYKWGCSELATLRGPVGVGVTP